MANTIIGLFETRTRAESARDDLYRAGFSEHEVSLSDQLTTESGAGEPSFWDQVKDFLGFEEAAYYEEGARRGGTVLTVDTDEARADAAVDLIEQHGPIDIDIHAQQWQQEGWQAPQREQQPRAATQSEQSVPLPEEELRVGKRRVQRGGVRIYTRVTETPVEENVELTEEHVDVERRPVDRPADEDTFRERTIEAEETHEEPVVRKEARTKEEIALNKESQTHEETVRDTVRKTEADVEHLGAQGGQGTGADGPAYQFGSELARDARYSGRPWESIELEVQRDYETRNLGDWSRDRDAVHQGYDRARRAA